MTPYSQIHGNKNKTYLIFFLFILIVSGFFFGVGKLYGNGLGYAALGFGISFCSSIFSYFFSDKIVLMTTGAKPASKEQFFDFYTVTENLCMGAGLPLPKLYVMEDPAPNAFATGRNPKHAAVCVTTGLLQIMERGELEGVIAHELSHIKNYDILVATMAAVLVGTVSLAADMLMRSLFWNSDDDSNGRHPFFYVLFIAAMIVIPIVATIIQLAISRKREFLADATGALMTRYPEGLARALEKISGYSGATRSATTSTAHLFIANPFKNARSMAWVGNLFSTHPPAAERIAILRSM